MISNYQKWNKHYDHERKKSINVDADIDDWKYCLIIALRQGFILNYLRY